MISDLASLGWDGVLAAAYHGCVGHDRWRRNLRPARVIEIDQGVCIVLGASGTERASLGGQVLVRGGAAAQTLPGVGDWVVLRTWPDRRTSVEAVLPRHGALCTAARVVAANIDILALVERTRPSADRVAALDHQARRAGCTALMVVTGATHQQRAANPPMPVLWLDRGESALVELRERAAGGRTIGLVGPAGAGKSALVRALVQAPVLAVAQARDHRRSGVNGSRVRLIPLPGGGAVVDTPGSAGMCAAGLDEPAPGESAPDEPVLLRPVPLPR